MFHFAALARAFRDQRLFDSYPELIAVFHALCCHLAPRHPPYALNCLTTFIQGSSQNEKTGQAILIVHLCFDARAQKIGHKKYCEFAVFTTTELSKSYAKFQSPVFGGDRIWDGEDTALPSVGQRSCAYFLKFAMRHSVEQGWLTK